MRKFINVAFIVLIMLMVGNVKSVRAFPANFFESEAGIAAYFSFTGPTNLKSNLLRNLFRTIPLETADYLVGYIPVEGLEAGNAQDVRVFIHNAGWVVAFYSDADPTAKIYKQRLTGNRLARTLDRVATAMELTSYTIHYHHFQHPEATKLTTAMLATTSTKTLDLRLPGSNQYFERSWYLSAWALFSSASLVLDGREIMGLFSALTYGEIQPDSMVTDAKHILTLTGSGVGAECELAILYDGVTPIPINYADAVTTLDLDPAPPELMLAASEVPFYLDTYLPIITR